MKKYFLILRRNIDWIRFCKVNLILIPLLHWENFCLFNSHWRILGCITRIKSPSISNDNHMMIIIIWQWYFITFGTFVRAIIGFFDICLSSFSGLSSSASSDHNWFCPMLSCSQRFPKYRARRSGRDLLKGNWVNLVSGKLKQRRELAKTGFQVSTREWSSFTRCCPLVWFFLVFEF